MVHDDRGGRTGPPGRLVGGPQGRMRRRRCSGLDFESDGRWTVLVLPGGRSLEPHGGFLSVARNYTVKLDC